MEKQRCLIMALALAGVLLLAGPGLAQQQGAGAGGVCPAGNQVCTGGPGGVCVINPPNTQGSQPGSRNPNSGKRRGPKGPGPGSRMNQAAPQTSPPADSQ